MTETTPSTGPGRPRDPDLETKLVDAAIDLFADEGWAGFNFQALANRAGVGKPAVYRRWKTKEDVLISAFAATDVPLDPIDTGSIRDDLATLARLVLQHQLSRRGLASLRMYVEAFTHPKLFAGIVESVFAQQVKAARTAVRRAIERGELAPGTSSTLVLDAIMGGVTAHVLSTPPHLRDTMIAGASAYPEQLVDLVLYGTPGLTAPEVTQPVTARRLHSQN
ncbi:TetR/AcrR family transcriptional regulator [Streptomyces flaveolus]|uniref:TetR/AcrR family transcriptional regulator n=1 Tax=Streptomyces flaveolus TaxID=67297 RepID=UPI00382D7A63